MGQSEDLERQRSSSNQEVEHARELGARIRSVRGAVSQDELATRLGTHKNTIARYERGERLPDVAFLRALGDAFGLDYRWLLTGQGPMLAAERAGLEARKAANGRTVGKKGEFGEGLVLVPRYDIRASAGPGALADEELIVDYMAFQEAWVRRIGADPRLLALITAVGDSMEPTIRAGDLLLVDTGVTRFSDDAIYVVSIDGALMVKRIQRFFGGAVAIKSDNERAYVDQTLSTDEAETVTVAGRVRWIGRMI